MSRYTSEKLFRLQYGYHELQGDEIHAPYLEHHYRNVNCVSDLSAAEKTAWYTRENNKDDILPEDLNKLVDRTVYQVLEQRTNSCNHNWTVEGWNHDKENMHWWNTWFGLKPKYIVELECSICGKKEVHRNLSFKEFCEIMIPINLKERLS